MEGAFQGELTCENFPVIVYSKFSGERTLENEILNSKFDTNSPCTMMIELTFGEILLGDDREARASTARIPFQ